LKNKIALLNWADLQVLGTTIAGRVDDKIMSYRTGTLDIRETPVPQAVATSQNIQITPLGIYVLDEKGVTLYSFTGY
jgi:hypothetical protein